MSSTLLGSVVLCMCVCARDATRSEAIFGESPVRTRCVMSDVGHALRMDVAARSRLAPDALVIANIASSVPIVARSRCPWMAQRSLFLSRRSHGTTRSSILSQAVGSSLPRAARYVGFMAEALSRLPAMSGRLLEAAMRAHTAAGLPEEPHGF